MSDGIGRSARLSPDGIYRYELHRTWSALEPSLPFVMLNPSTADAEHDDPTIRRCMHFARREGYGGIVVVNLYALKATDPGQLRLHYSPTGGQDNDETITSFLSYADHNSVPVVCAWGVERTVRYAPMRRRVGWLQLEAKRWHADLRCLGVTQRGEPKHPLARGQHRISDDASLVDWPVR